MKNKKVVLSVGLVLFLVVAGIFGLQYFSADAAPISPIAYQGDLEVPATRSDTTPQEDDASMGLNSPQINLVSDPGKYTDHSARVLSSMEAGKSYDINIALKGEVKNDAKILVTWVERSCNWYRKCKNRNKEMVRPVSPSELSKENWSIVHANFTLPGRIEGQVTLYPLRVQNGGSFIGQIDGISVTASFAGDIKTDKNGSMEYNYSLETLPLLFNSDKPVFSLTPTGTYSLQRKDSFVKILLVDKNNGRHLIFRDDAYYSREGNFPIIAKEEGQLLPGVTVQGIEIQTRHAYVDMNSLQLVTDPDNLSLPIRNRIQGYLNNGNNWQVSYDNTREELIRSGKQAYFDKMNAWSKNNNKGVTFGGEENLKTTYQELFATTAVELNPQYLDGAQSRSWITGGIRKVGQWVSNQVFAGRDPFTFVFEIKNNISLFSSCSNLRAGWKIYRDIQSERELDKLRSYETGVLHIPNWEAAPVVSSSKFPSSFDWRNHHGVDWTLPIDQFSQSIGDCWAWAATHAIESAINLKYNDETKLGTAPFTLSKQWSMCQHPELTATNGVGGFSRYVFSAITGPAKKRIPSKAELPYSGDSKDCAPAWSTPDQDGWTLSSYDGIDKENGLFASDESIKAALFTKGPLSFVVPSLYHVMLLVGWETNEKNQTVWIMKNSWGAKQGENRYNTSPMGVSSIDSTSKPTEEAICEEGEQLVRLGYQKDTSYYATCYSKHIAQRTQEERVTQSLSIEEPVFDRSCPSDFPNFERLIKKDGQWFKLCRQSISELSAQGVQIQRLPVSVAFDSYCPNSGEVTGLYEYSEGWKKECSWIVTNVYDAGYESYMTSPRQVRHTTALTCPNGGFVDSIAVDNQDDPDSAWTRECSQYDGGYYRMTLGIHQRAWIYYISDPTHSSFQFNQDNKIKCVDRDGDGYFTWGLNQSKPTSCPADTPLAQDCNDADASVQTYIAGTNLCVPRISDGLSDSKTPAVYDGPSQ